MQTRALSAPLLSAHTTAVMQITAPWIISWLAPMKQIPTWISAPIVCPSVRSKNDAGSTSESCRGAAKILLDNPIDCDIIKKYLKYTYIFHKFQI